MILGRKQQAKRENWFASLKNSVMSRYITGTICESLRRVIRQSGNDCNSRPSVVDPPYQKRAVSHSAFAWLSVVSPTPRLQRQPELDPHTKRGRVMHGRCLVVRLADNALEFVSAGRGMKIRNESDARLAGAASKNQVAVLRRAKETHEHKGKTKNARNRK